MSRHLTRWNKDDATRDGFWGPATSSIDWCEANYIRSWYVAEMFNTVSNSAFIALALYGVYRVRQQRLPTRLAIAFWAVATIGLGSTLFHATLQYTWQLGDELPMIYTSCGLSWIVFDLSPIRSPVNWAVPTLLAVFSVVFTAAYVAAPNPVFHQVTYAILVSATFYRTMWLLWRKGIPDRTLAEARKYYILGAVQFGGAFGIWNFDNMTCNNLLTPLKERLGAPWNWFLEGHAWWHIFTGLGAYNIIVSLSLITLALRDSPDHFQIVSTWTIPYVKRTKKGWEAWDTQQRQQVKNSRAGTEQERLLQDGLRGELRN